MKEELVVCKICQKYLTPNTDTANCFRCSEKIHDEKFKDFYEEDILIEEE